MGHLISCYTSSPSSRCRYISPAANEGLPDSSAEEIPCNCPTHTGNVSGRIVRVTESNLPVVISSSRHIRRQTGSRVLLSELSNDRNKLYETRMNKAVSLHSPPHGPGTDD